MHSDVGIYRESRDRREGGKMGWRENGMAGRWDGGKMGWQEGRKTGVLFFYLIICVLGFFRDPFLNRLLSIAVQSHGSMFLNRIE